VSDLLLLAVALAPLSLLAAVRPTYRIAPITAVIALLAGVNLNAPWIPALHRVAEISLGTAVGVAVSLVVLPSHARELARAALARALPLQVDLLRHYLIDLDSVPQSAINALNDRFRNEVAQAEKALVETQHEPGGHTDTLQSLIRAVRRLHSDILFVGRITQSWHGADMPAALQLRLAALEQALRDVLNAIAAQLAATKAAGPQRVPAVPLPNLSLGAIDKALGQLTQALQTESPSALHEAALLPVIAQILRRDLSGLVDTVSQISSKAL